MWSYIILFYEDKELKYYKVLFFLKSKKKVFVKENVFIEFVRDRISNIFEGNFFGNCNSY